MISLTYGSVNTLQILVVCMKEHRLEWRVAAKVPLWDTFWFFTQNSHRRLFYDIRIVAGGFLYEFE